MSEAMTPKERRMQLAGDIWNAMIEPFAKQEDRRLSVEIWLHMFEDVVTSDLAFQTQIDQQKEELTQYKNVVEAAREFVRATTEVANDIDNSMGDIAIALARQGKRAAAVEKLKEALEKLGGNDG